MNKAIVDVVIDVETLAKHANAVVASVACVAVFRKTGKVVKEFHEQISVQESLKLGFERDSYGVKDSTVDWWIKQSDAARLELCGTKQPREVFLYLLDWFHGLAESYDLRVWGNGLKFDIDKLERHFVRLGYAVPWSGFAERDIRTAVELGRELGINPKADIAFDGVAHNALDDARHEAKYLFAIFEHARLAGSSVGLAVKKSN